MTGATGFFGKSLFAHLPQLQNYDIVAVSRRVMPNHHNITYLLGDVRDFHFPEGDFDYIYHGAAPSSSIDPIPDKEMASIIVDGTRRVVDFAKETNAKVLFVSSGAVYGKHRFSPAYESSLINPEDSYGRAKVEAEHMVGELDNYAIARCFAFIGEYLPLDAPFAVCQFIKSCLNDVPIVIHNKATLRSYMYSSDLAEWLWTIMTRGVGIYNVGSSLIVPLDHLAYTVRGHAKSHNPIDILQDEHLTCYVPETGKAQTELGLDIKVGLEEAVKRTIDFHRRVDEDFRLHYTGAGESK
jgi:nucleoside-diphosphate-sugar epimerase